MRYGSRTWLAVLAFALVSSPSAFAYKGSYADVKKLLADLAAKYPKNAKVFTLGLSDSGEAIQGLQVGDGPVHNLIVSTHHGNEYGATEVGKAIAASLAETPITGQTIYVIPVLNISGYNSLNRYETFKGGSQDPNRDYPGPCATEGPFKLKDTKALADFIDKQNIVASATIHTFSPAVVYPWGISTHDTSTPYDDTFIQLAKACVVESGYPIGNNTEMIYPADGTFEDYAYWKHGIWSLLWEIGDTHSPSDSQLAELVRVNVPGLRRMMEQAPRQRAEKHDFTGRCDLRLTFFDRHDE